MRFPLRFLVAVAALTAPLSAGAMSNRVFLGPAGNDSGDCANPLTPCLTFAGALAQVNPGGEVIAEATGGYGPLNIPQAVTISGPSGVVMFTGVGVTINAPGATVVLRGLTIDGAGVQGIGVNVMDVGSLTVENCVIANFAGVGFHWNGAGILLTSGNTLYVADTMLLNNGWVGISVNPPTGSARASINHCHFEGGSFGLFSGPAAKVTVRDSVATFNSEVGFAALGGSPAELNLENCIASNNGVGLSSTLLGSIVRVSNTMVTDNAIGLQCEPESFMLTRGNNTVEGNPIEGSFSGTYSAK